MVYESAELVRVAPSDLVHAVEKSGAEAFVAELADGTCWDLAAFMQTVPLGMAVELEAALAAAGKRLTEEWIPGLGRHMVVRHSILGCVDDAGIMPPGTGLKLERKNDP